MELPAKNCLYIYLVIIFSSVVTGKPAFEIIRPKSETEPSYELADMNSKIDKLHYIVSTFDRNFKWENSILTEIAQTQAYVLQEIRDQEKRIKRLNRLMKKTMIKCGKEPENGNVVPGAEKNTRRRTSDHRYIFSNEVERHRRYLIP